MESVIETVSKQCNSGQKVCYSSCEIYCRTPKPHDTKKMLKSGDKLVKHFFMIKQSKRKSPLMANYFLLLFYYGKYQHSTVIHVWFNWWFTLCDDITPSHTPIYGNSLHTCFQPCQGSILQVLLFRASGVESCCCGFVSSSGFQLNFPL